MAEGSASLRHRAKRARRRLEPVSAGPLSTISGRCARDRCVAARAPASVGEVRVQLRATRLSSDGVTLSTFIVSSASCSRSPDRRDSVVRSLGPPSVGARRGHYWEPGSFLITLSARGSATAVSASRRVSIQIQEPTSTTGVSGRSFRAAVSQTPGPERVPVGQVLHDQPRATRGQDPNQRQRWVADRFSNTDRPLHGSNPLAGRDRRPFVDISPP
jgi:hypothetical protein